MNRGIWVSGWLSAWALALGTIAPAMAQGASTPQPAAQAVRLSSVEGRVRIVEDNQLLADPALVNTPLFEGTQVMTSQDGQAELQFDGGSIIRLTPNSALTLTSLSKPGGQGNAEVALEGGMGYFELHNEDAASQTQVRFGDSVVTASGFAVLRISLDNPPGELAVFSGNASLRRGDAAALYLHGGESAVLNGASPTQSILDESIKTDSWDAWNADREQALNSAETARTGAASNMPDSNNPAWSDLDANGNWYDVPGQGEVWSPYEAASSGWEPYGSGYWMWTPRFGYIWVSGNSWGYLPYQCGVWNHFSDFGWGWMPGRCRPWWGGGLWSFNIGIAPGGYRPPDRPRPIRPHPPHPRPVPLNGGFATPPNAVVAVNRRPADGAIEAPARDRDSAVTIGGHVAQPLRTLSARPVYTPSGSGVRGASQFVGSPAAQRPAFGGSRPGYAPPARPSPAPSYSRPASPVGGAPSSHSSMGGRGGSSGGGGGGKSPR
jgi:hypothetical protein